MIFFGVKWYKDNGVFDVITKNNSDQDLLLTDDIDQIVEHIIAHADAIGLPYGTFESKPILSNE